MAKNQTNNSGLKQEIEDLKKRVAELEAKVFGAVQTEDSSNPPPPPPPPPR